MAEIVQTNNLIYKKWSFERINILIFVEFIVNMLNKLSDSFKLMKSGNNWKLWVDLLEFKGSAALGDLQQ